MRKDVARYEGNVDRYLVEDFVITGLLVIFQLLSRNLYRFSSSYRALWLRHIPTMSGKALADAGFRTMHPRPSAHQTRVSLHAQGPRPFHRFVLHSLVFEGLYHIQICRVRLVLQRCSCLCLGVVGNSYSTHFNSCSCFHWSDYKLLYRMLVSTMDTLFPGCA